MKEKTLIFKWKKKTTYIQKKIYKFVNLLLNYKDIKR